MTIDERKMVQKILVTMADFYSRKISADAISLISDALSDLDGQQVITALKKYMTGADSKFFPLPGQIRAMISPEASGDQLALEAANKIIEAMGKFGWTNPEKAREFMGPLAWEVVVRDGGWVSLCERTKNDDLPILRAQWRELAKVVSVRQKQAEQAALGDSSGHKRLVGEQTKAIESLGGKP